MIREIRSSDVVILFVSHFLDQAYEISDWMTAELPRMELISMMLGRTGDALDQIEGQAHARREDEGENTLFLSAQGIGRRGAVEPYSLDIHRGEVVGLAGLLGSGRTEAARLLCGADKADEGKIEIKGKQVTLSDPLSALKQSIVYSTEDRKRDGIVGDLTVRENIAPDHPGPPGAMPPLPGNELEAIIARLMKALDIHPNNPGMLICNLSGGNQQKVLLARWLATDPTLLILDEPTRGIDIGTKAEIQRLVTELATDGCAVVFISSELEEAMCC